MTSMKSYKHLFGIRWFLSQRVKWIFRMLQFLNLMGSSRIRQLLFPTEFDPHLSTQ